MDNIDYKIRNLEKKVNELQQLLSICLKKLDLDINLCDGCSKFTETINVKEKYENSYSRSQMLENYGIVYACKECEDKYM